MDDKITLQKIEKTFKRWFIENNHSLRYHLLETELPLLFKNTIKNRELVTRIHYLHNGETYTVELLKFYKYMNEFDFYTNFFTEHFVSFLSDENVKDIFIDELNHFLVKYSKTYTSWPERLKLTHKIKNIEDYIEQRKSSGFMFWVCDSFPWTKIKNQDINWGGICTRWRHHILDVITKK